MSNMVKARREMGNGHWDKALMRRMVRLSNADNYDEAKDEWIATGDVWWTGRDIGEGEYVPQWVQTSEKGQGKCLCGHDVVYHFKIENTENGNVECVGSDHINSYLIMRQMALELNVDTDEITEEQVQEWINVRVKSMKSEAWWKANGSTFTEMFNFVKEIDLWKNSKIKDYRWDYELQRSVPVRIVRKSNKGEFGKANYRMKSIVWRWNHPDNPKAQINTTGIPNERLMQDLGLFYIQCKAKHHQEYQDYKAELQARKDEIARQMREREAERRRQQEIREAERAEALRIWNLPENVAKREEERLRQEAERKAREERLEREREERARIQAQALKERIERETQSFQEERELFDMRCDAYGIKAFDVDYASNNWEITFLADMRKRIINQSDLTSNQLATLRNIVNRQPTEKQLSYLKALGYEGEVKNKSHASTLIDELKKGDE